MYGMTYQHAIDISILVTLCHEYIEMAMAIQNLQQYAPKVINLLGALRTKSDPSPIALQHWQTKTDQQEVSIL